jgi:hypothetical protein
MARSQNTIGREDASGDVDRYRQAAEDGLQQLDWAIGYLHGIRKTGIRRRGAKNRSSRPDAADGQARRADAGPETSET